MLKVLKHLCVSQVPADKSAPGGEDRTAVPRLAGQGLPGPGEGQGAHPGKRS